MRCVCCNSNLSDWESTLKHPVTGEYLDICRKCLPDTEIIPDEPSGMVDDTPYDDEEIVFEREEDVD